MTFMIVIGVDIKVLNTFMIKVIWLLMSSSIHEHSFVNGWTIYNSLQSNVYFKKIYQIHSSLHQTTQQTDDLQYFH